jgi:hypothetical protein
VNNNCVDGKCNDKLVGFFGLVEKIYQNDGKTEGDDVKDVEREQRGARKRLQHRCGKKKDDLPSDLTINRCLHSRRDYLIICDSLVQNF